MTISKERLRKEDWMNFPFSTFFSSNSIIPNWICSLAQVANDINTANLSLVSIVKANPKLATPEVVYYFALTCSHIREGTKFISETICLDEVAKFINDLDVRAKTSLASIQSTYEPWENSFIKCVVKSIRDSFFHYPLPNENAWTELKSTLHDENGEIRLEDTTYAGTRFVFADDVRVNYYQILLEESGSSLEENMAKIAEVVENVVIFTQAAVIKHLDEFPQGALRIGKKPAITTR